MRAVFVLLVAALLAGCAVSGDKTPPAWLQGEPDDYPAKRYLIGRGQGATPERAQDRARAELAKAFAVRIKASSRDSSRFHSEKGGGKIRQRLEYAVSREVNTFTDQMVEGVEIADLWLDPQRDVFYALAVLDRERAAQRLKDEMIRLDGRAMAALKRAASGDALLRVRALYAAYRAVAERRALTAAFQVVSARRPPPAPVDPARLEERLLQALGRLQISVSARPAELAAALGDALTELGVPLVKEGAAHRLRGELVVTPVGERAGWYWLRAVLAVSLEGREGGMAERRQPLKAAALDEAQARARLLRQAADEVKRVVPEMIFGESSFQPVPP